MYAIISVSAIRNPSAAAESAELPLSSSHDDQFWASTVEHNHLNMKLFELVTSPDELIYSGMLECSPRLQVVLVDTNHRCNLVSCSTKLQ